MVAEVQAEATASPVSNTGSGRGRIATWRLAAFAAPCIPVSAMLMPVSVYLPNYYATELGVSLATLAMVFSVIRFFDLGLDPLLGFLIDKTNSRWGRFRPWLVAGAPIAVLAVWMMFMARPGVTGAYLLFWLIVGFIGQSMASMAHVAWAARIAPDYDQRSRVFGWWQAFIVIGMICVLGMPPIMKFGFGFDFATGVQSMGWFIIAALPPTILLALMSMGEPPIPANAPTVEWRALLRLLSRPTVVRLLLTDIALGVGPALAGSLLFFYFDAVRGVERSMTGLLLIVYFLGALAGAPLWSKLAQRIGKHRALAAAALCYVLAQLGVLISPSGLAWGFLTMGLAGLPFGAGAILLRAMMADVGDEERLASGVDRTALLYGLLSGSQKIGTGVAVLAGLNALHAVGFDAKLGTGNSPAALTAVTIAFSIVPAACGFIGALVIRGHKLDAAAHADIRRRLAERDAQLEL